MARAVILKTDKGVLLLGTIQCSNGSWFDAEGCFQYCNREESDLENQHQSMKLKANATLLGREIMPVDWFKHRENFIDIDVPFECMQEYK